MSSITVQLRFVVEEHMRRFKCSKEQAYNMIIGNYPIFDENYRNVLNEKIFRHYGFREIGLETPELFKYFLQTKMNEIMVYYNQLYKSESIDYNPLYNIDITESFERDVDNTNATTSVGENTNTLDRNGNTNEENTNNNTSQNTESIRGKTIQNDVPQSGITSEQIDNNTYVTAYSKDTQDNTTNSTIVDNGTNATEYNVTSNSKENNKQNVDIKANTTENYVRKTIGSSAGLPFSKAIKQWREVMINIDMKIINELPNLFIGTW